MSNVCDSSICFTRADDIVLMVAVMDGCGINAAPVDITGATVIEYSLAKSNGCDVVLTKTLLDGIEITASPDNNTLEITLTSAETTLLCGVYAHSCYVIDALGKRTTIFQSDSVCIAK